MKVPYNWLKSYINFSYTPRELAHELTMAGLEVESVDFCGEGLEDIIIGEIKQVKAHPDADKLSVCEVFNGVQTLKIVCGASNVKAGIKVPVAPVGAVLPDGNQIKKS